MYLFFVTIFSIYGGMHLYAFLRARAALDFGTGTGAALAFFMLIMTFAPFIVRASERQGLEILARVMSYTGYIWMGMLFIFVVSAFTFDIFRLLVLVAESVLNKDLTHMKPSTSFLFFVPLIMSVLISTYGYFEAVNIKLEKVTIKTSKIPEDIGRLRIAQISDVHIGLIVRENRLKRVLERVKAAEPDILVSTGDLVDGQLDNLLDISEMFMEIDPKYGKYAITGNHEFYAGLDHALGFIEQAGFTVLRNKGVTVQDLINIVGVDDPTGKRFGLSRGMTEKELLSRQPSEKFTLLLKHRPFVDKDSIGLFDLQLSGHTHKGQIFPFSLITKMYYPKQAGLLRLQENASLYVSRGSGTWGPPIRFLAPPEVTLIELVYDKNAR
ncbi:MAG TPA: metallophosphoesterase [Nitrospirae bacterium]|nr:putative metallophosphoesterase [bacterium BMS3Abin10]GBE38180.1 putative metallophosphoesterase [bacterium BMS3Bbin08]HDH51044.1 metallophosphoesterase [Nitrospirota bacterium]HDO25819.1 metallophosphoesterase [Nitrospirota bacterium]HDZ84833.1 metallophosphoesterase [Nitrospirota bacterium]